MNKSNDSKIQDEFYDEQIQSQWLHSLLSKLSDNIDDITGRCFLFLIVKS